MPHPLQLREGGVARVTCYWQYCWVQWQWSGWFLETASDTGIAELQRRQWGSMENVAELKRVRVGSLFGHLEMQPPDTVFHVKDRFLADKHPKKVNLGVGGERQSTT